MTPESSIEVFSTCPPSTGVPQELYLERFTEIARWSEEAGCRGILLFSDNSVLDPWMLAHLILQRTKTLCPLIAVQPVYMHPYWVAKQIASLAYLYGRRLYLNMVAGGFKNDLEALDDTTPHDKRYARLIEYTLVIMGLLSSRAPLSFDGKFHRVSKLKLAPSLPEALQPGVFVSGSSDAGITAARVLGATAIKYPKPPDEEEERPAGLINPGIRVGIIARRTDKEAWDVAEERFPEDRKGQLTRQLAEKVSDSVWHKQLSGLEATDRTGPYWLTPFQNYKAMCPYLVGSYETVGAELGRYFASGYRTVILDIPPSLDDLRHSFTAISAAMEPVQS